MPAFHFPAHFESQLVYKEPASVPSESRTSRVRGVADALQLRGDCGHVDGYPLLPPDWVSGVVDADVIVEDYDTSIIEGRGVARADDAAGDTTPYRLHGWDCGRIARRSVTASSTTCVQ